MNYINTTTGEYPYSLWQLRRDNPNTSFPAEPTEVDILPFGCRFVYTTPQPNHDPRTQQVVELPPEPGQGDSYYQRWQVVAASPEQIIAWDQANAPQPDWDAFREGLRTQNGYQQYFAQAAQQQPLTATSLPVDFYEFRKSGNYGPFLTLLSQVFSLLPLEDRVHALTEMIQLAQACHLPQAFIDELIHLAQSSAP